MQRRNQHCHWLHLHLHLQQQLDKNSRLSISDQCSEYFPSLSPALKTSESDTFYNRSEKRKNPPPRQVYTKRPSILLVKHADESINTFIHSLTHTNWLIYVDGEKVMRLHVRWWRDTSNINKGRRSDCILLVNDFHSHLTHLSRFSLSMNGAHYYLFPATWKHRVAS